jgi:hypothetical protein
MLRCSIGTGPQVCKPLFCISLEGRAEGIGSPALLLAPPLCLFDLGIDALADVFAPLARDFPGLGERHCGILADPARDRVCASREPRDEHKGALVIIGTAISYADAEAGDLRVIYDIALSRRRGTTEHVIRNDGV